MKRKMPTSADLDFRLDQPCGDTAARFAGFLHGHKTDNELWGCDGVPILLEAALLRTYSTNRHRFCVNIGGTWFELTDVPLGTLEGGALAGHIVDTGKSPDQIQHEKDVEDERSGRIFRENHKKQARREHWEGVRERSEAKQQAAIAARQW